MSPVQNPLDLAMRRFNSKDYALFTLFGILALFIWVRDLSWFSSAEDTLPILIALPLFWILGRPWALVTHPFTLPTSSIFSSTLLFLLGIACDNTLVLALAWTLLLWSYIKQRVEPQSHASIKKLLVLPLLSFPWITLNMQELGWYFRLSGAWAAATLFDALGYRVKQEGTMLLVEHLPISVEAACAGLNTLQSMLIAGSIVAYMILGKTNRYWINLLLLIFMAWIANTSRIIVISTIALLFGSQFAMGAFHTWGGWLILLIMFLLSWLIFELQAPKAVGR